MYKEVNCVINFLKYIKLYWLYKIYLKNECSVYGFWIVKIIIIKKIVSIFENEKIIYMNIVLYIVKLEFG